MQSPTRVRSVARKLLGPWAMRYVRQCLGKTVPELGLYRSLLAGKHGLEIGGPSWMLGDDGPLPIYRVIGSLDNCQYSVRAVTGPAQERSKFGYHPLKRPGYQIVCEGSDLAPIEDAAYECVLASHCLEHMANPLRALGEWRRVLKEDGVLLVILPHKDGTFDWRRPITTIAHLIKDYETGVGENDLTHLPEILALSDFEREKSFDGSKEQLQQVWQENYSNRCMHHHVFDTATALTMVDHAAFQVIRVANLGPFHIVILARRCQGVPDNARFLGPKAEYRRRSPFP